MKTAHTRRLRRAALLAASAVSVAATVLGTSAAGAAASPATGSTNPIVRTNDGLGSRRTRTSSTTITRHSTSRRPARCRPWPRTAPNCPYLFTQPNAPFPATLTASQQALAASMRADWASFAASGNPSTHALPWPSFGNSANVLSLVPAASAVQTDFAAAHHCSFWAAG